MNALIAIAIVFCLYKFVLDFKSYQLQKFNSEMLASSNKQLIERANSLTAGFESESGGLTPDQIGAALAGDLAQQNDDIQIRMEQHQLKAELAYHADKIVEAHSYAISFEDAFAKAIIFVKNKCAVMDRPLEDSTLEILGVNRVSTGKPQQEQPVLTPVQ